MPFHLRVVSASLLLCAASRLLNAQNSSWESRPEVDLYVQLGERVRLVFQDSLTFALETHSSKGNFSGFIEVALRPCYESTCAIAAMSSANVS
jgi:hypothetical protein